MLNATNRANFLSTIIIKMEVQAEIRGYNLIGREFVLYEDQPRKDTAVTLDGVEAQGEYWVVHKSEYLRVVPEADGRMLKGDLIYIPTFVAQLSLRPRYLKVKA
jgi:hypothetical protein